MDQRPDRRKEARGGRRFRDRLLERTGTDNPALAERHLLANQLLLIDDDLRQTALALGAVEQFLGAALELLESPEVSAGDLATLASDGDALDKLDELSETVESLRRRLLAVASNLR
jgi:hypothetical protein